MLKQLWALSISLKAYSVNSSQRVASKASTSLWRWFERPKLALRDDDARALGLILETGSPGETYNVGGRNERRNIDVAGQICAHLDELRPSEKPYERLITYVADQPGLDQRYAIDAAKLETELGWRAQETFETGIKKTVRWYLDRADWWRPLRNNPCPGNRLGALA